MTGATRFLPSPPTVGNYAYIFATSSVGDHPQSTWARDIRVMDRTW